MGAELKNRLILLALAPLLLCASLLWWLRYAGAVIASPQRAWRLAVAKDQLANAAFNGHEDETISSRAARARDAGRRWGCVLCRWLDALDSDHCDKSRGV